MQHLFGLAGREMRAYDMRRLLVREVVTILDTMAA